MNLYHYRSVESARKEIECRTFRYADRNELNDPLEGYAQIYWKGDCPAWEGLFRNYICSVYYAVVGIQLNASEELWAGLERIIGSFCTDSIGAEADSRSRKYGDRNECPPLEANFAALP